jgi:hypothetical protein
MSADDIRRGVVPRPDCDSDVCGECGAGPDEFHKDDCPCKNSTGQKIEPRDIAYPSELVEQLETATGLSTRLRAEAVRLEVVARELRALAAVIER